MEYIKVGTFVETFIPPQIINRSVSIAEKLSDGIQIISGNTIKSIILNFIISLILQLIWVLMRDISFLTILSLVSLPVPGIANVI
jgi:hypothetical protein